MIFYNDEETECGGLVFEGQKDSVSGKPVASGHLSFDQYNQNQVVYVSYGEENRFKQMGFNIDEWQSEPSFKEWRDKIGRFMKQLLIQLCSVLFIINYFIHQLTK